MRLSTLGNTDRRLPCTVCAVATFAWLAFATFGTHLHAQAKPPASRVASGPVAGAPLHSLKVAQMTANGFHELDLLKELGSAPAAILFVHEFTRPAAQVVRSLDALGAEFAAFGLETRTVLLSEDRTTGEQWLQRSRRALNLFHPFSLSVDGATGPGDYALARKAAVTLVVAKAGKVVDAIGWTDVGAKDAAYLRSQVERLLPAKRQDADLVATLPSDPELLKARIASLAAVIRHQQAQIRKLGQRRQNQRMQQRTRGERKPKQPMVDRPTSSRPMRDQPMRERPTQPGQGQPKPATGTRRVGKAPTDATLRTLLRNFIQRTNDQAKVEQVMGKIETRVGQDAILRQQAIEMFRLIQSLGYGTDAARAAGQQYVTTHRKPKKAANR